ncbi:MAG TPA: IS3 family transposase, partial [Nitrospiraceae bacterium]|nr:IS3 family transposase [Nitrospiraceae bacterium]
MARQRKSYTPEYKEQIARIVVEESRAIPSMAREIGINEQTLRNWVNAYRQAHAGEEPPLTISERARLRELEKEVRELKLEREFLGKSRRVLRQRVSVEARYELIDAEKRTLGPDGRPVHTVVKMCAWLGVSSSGYYEWRKRPQSATAARRETLRQLIVEIFDASDETYGYRRIHAALLRSGQACSLEFVRALVRELGLVPCQPRPWRHSLTDQDPAAGPIPDLVRRDFTAPAPGIKMVGDITYIATWQGWVFLATVIDCCTKAVVGWAMSDNYKTSLISAAIRMAVRNHDIKEGAIFHSDRGSNYTSAEFGRVLRELGIRQSVGRTGSCYDNALAESFFATLKNERVHRTEYPTRKHAMNDIARYIELRYNSRRLHSGLGYK